MIDLSLERLEHFEECLALQRREGVVPTLVLDEDQVLSMVAEIRRWRADAASDHGEALPTGVDDIPPPFLP